MKKNLRNILLATAALGCSATASAQSLNSAYFLDGYTYGHQLNPAKDYATDMWPSPSWAT